MEKEIGAENKVFLSKNLRKEEKLAHVSVLKSSQEETKSPRKDANCSYDWPLLSAHQQKAC